MEVSPEGYAELGRIVRSIAPDAAPDRIGVVFEGGYSIRGLGACMVSAVRTLLLRNEKPETPREHPHEVVEVIVDAARRAHDDRWWS
jgi:acetoin utilization deacetylase AcuC-like enzyme